MWKVCTAHNVQRTKGALKRQWWTLPGVSGKTSLKRWHPCFGEKGVFPGRKGVRRKCIYEDAKVGKPWHPFSQFSSVAQLCLTLCNSCSMPGFHQLPELAQTHIHRFSDAIQPSHPLSSPSPPAFNISQHQGLFQGVNSSHQVAQVLEFQLQYQSLQWIFRTDFL